MKCKDCDVIGCPNRGSNAVFSKPCTIINQDSFDWQSLRAEAAKDILCIVLEKAISRGDLSAIPELIHECIMISDELIKQLKEKEEK